MANANADHNVSNRESHATRFEIDRMPISPQCVSRIYTETRTECNEKWSTLRNLCARSAPVDQLFNSSEKRRARVWLLLTDFGKDGKPETLVPKMSQETLAEMKGTTRSRVSVFRNRFRTLGFVDYHAGDELQVHSSPLNIVLHD
jgi:hypothetical protein